MIVAIHQPHYLPWLRYFAKMACAGVFVGLDDTQFEKNGWQNRNKIKIADGWTYLTVPVRHRHQQSLHDVRIDNSTRWRAKHWQTIRHHYRGSPHFEWVAASLETFYRREWEYLADLNWEMLHFFAQLLGIRTPLIRGSDLRCPGRATEKLAHLTLAVGGDTYLSGAYAAATYLDASYLKQCGIGVVCQQWRPPHYQQLYPGVGFVPDLAIIDLLFNHGPASLDVLLRAAEPTGVHHAD